MEQAEKKTAVYSRKNTAADCLGHIFSVLEKAGSTDNFSAAFADVLDLDALGAVADVVEVAVDLRTVCSETEGGKKNPPPQRARGEMFHV
jgi:hypothetical protein